MRTNGLEGRLTTLVGLVVMMSLAGLVAEAEARPDDVRFRAELFGDAVTSGHARYRERERNAGLDRRFKVQVEDAPVGTQLEVRVNGELFGVITVNALGRGRLQLRTPQFIDDPGDGDPMPASFPRLGPDDVVTVGSLSGVFFERGPAAAGQAQRYRVRARLPGANDQLDGQVRYLERFKNGRLLRRFKAELEDGEPGDVHQVVVEGFVVGSIVLDDFGEGELELRTEAFIDDPDDGDPIPDAFPSLLPGDVVQVGPLTGVLELD